MGKNSCSGGLGSIVPKVLTEVALRPPADAFPAGFPRGSQGLRGRPDRPDRPGRRDVRQKKLTEDLQSTV